MVPFALGTALAGKFRGNSGIVAVFMGDGTLGQGIVYECLNIAARWRIPVLFVVEANCYAMSTPTIVQHAGDASERAIPFGIPSTTADGNDVFQVYDTCASLVQQVREEHFPRYLVLQTYRLGPHSKGDDVRSQGEIDTHRKKDPIARLRKQLVAENEKQVNSMEKEVEERIQSAVQAAQQAPVWDLEPFLDECAITGVTDEHDIS